MKPLLFIAALTIALLLPVEARAELRAGAAKVDVTPRVLPVIRNGGFLEASDNRVVDSLHARCLVLDDRATRLAIVVVDSCMLPRDLCDEVKRLSSGKTGIPFDRILISATHCHSAPSSMSYCLGSRVDPRYSAFLPGKIVEAIVIANDRLQPAKATWGRVDAAEFTACRRWSFLEGSELIDPFGKKTVRANMHPGYGNKNAIGPTGPADPWLSFLSVQTTDGKPLSVLANFSMHYFSGHPGVSADYAGLFSESLAKRLAPGDEVFVGIMSQGTSGDSWWGDYSRDKRRSWSIQEYTDQLVDLVAKRLAKLEHSVDVPLGMAEVRPEFFRRTPDDNRLKWAHSMLAEMNGQRPRNRPEVYAEQAVWIHENPVEEVPLQAVRIGDLGITAIPCEVYALTGLKLKSASPLPLTFNISLANGASGYIPPPEQHAIGGYTTWPARTAGLEVNAEPRIVEETIRLLEKASGLKRKKYIESVSPYAKTVIDSKPTAFWRLGEQAGPIAADATGNGHQAQYEPGVTFHLPGHRHPFSESNHTSRAAHFVGGRVVAKAPLSEEFSVEFWLWNGVIKTPLIHDISVAEFGRFRLQIIDDPLLGGPNLTIIPGREGMALLSPREWHLVTVVCRKNNYQLWLDGILQLEEKRTLSLENKQQPNLKLIFGGWDDASIGFSGKLDEIAFFNRALAKTEIQKHFGAANPSNQNQASGSIEVKPLSSADSMSLTHVPEGFELQLVVDEPLVRDPVAFDWGPDGELWVAEMADYPMGMDNKGKYGGRVRLVTDSDNDGRYDKSTVFLDGLSFPAGVMPWRKGVLVAAAPILLYAEDTDSDGKADIRQTLFEGFYEGNQQLRINGLYWGLDNTVHCAAGAAWGGYGGANTIKSIVSGKSVAIHSSDFRFDPDTGWIEATSGPSQFGRVRDDWGNWFGVQNSHPLWHYVLPARYLRRNRDVAYPDSRRQVRTPRNPKVYPNKPPQKRFHSYEQSGRYTSACGPSIYRDTLLFGDDNITHAFTCEPFHNVVQHSVLRDSIVSFEGERANDGEKDFFASADRWSRPVFTRTGPDGALWIADMYRYMIEHPEWLPKNGQDELRPHFRSGEAFGRIYRVVSKAKPLRALPKLSGQKPVELAGFLSSPNGTVRDMAHRLIVESGDGSVAGKLNQMLEQAELPQARLHALAALDGLGKLDTDTLGKALPDKHPYVRRLAFRLAEKFPSEGEYFAPFFVFEPVRQLDERQLKVLLQQLFTAGFFTNQNIGKALARFISEGFSEIGFPYFEAALLSSADVHYEQVLRASTSGGRFFEQLMRMGIKKKQATLSKKLDSIWQKAKQEDAFRVAKLWMSALGQAGVGLDNLEEGGFPEQTAKLKNILKEAEAVSLDSGASLRFRAAAIAALSYGSALHDGVLPTLTKLIQPTENPAMRYNAIKAVGNMSQLDSARMLLGTWPSLQADERARALDVLLSRSTWQGELLGALETSRISANGFSAVHRDRLLKSRNKSTAERAKLIFDTVVTPDRAEALAKSLPALKLKGDSERGRLVYEMLCAECHAPDKQLGPDLRSITDRSGKGLLASIIDPSRLVEPKYIAYTVVLNDGQAMVGIIGTESGESLQINVPGAGHQTINRNQLKSLASLDQSLMPNGLEAGLTHQNIADLVKFLQITN
ncbi:MAG: PVC-type heme-binding CxxCH protein [Verrucomicrobiota bacterium]|nr:PVC-type heme-binding CxxCH protein [Verrucomicrobiota bacterium]